MPDLPKTVSDKIRRIELRKHEIEIRSKKIREEQECFESDFIKA